MATRSQYRQAQTELAGAVGSKLSAVLAALDPEPGRQETLAAYARTAVAVVGGGQRRAAGLGVGFMAGVAPPRSRPSLERALAGVTVTDQAPVASSPVLRLWGLLAEGAPLPTAQAEAGAYAAGLASGDLQVAERAGMAEGAAASGEEIVGWRKMLGPDACEWCVLVGEERVYNEADTVPFHANDQCGVEPVLRGESE